jgi:hypothetical protein
MLTSIAWQSYVQRIVDFRVKKTSKVLDPEEGAKILHHICTN